MNPRPPSTPLSREERGRAAITSFPRGRSPGPRWLSGAGRIRGIGAGVLLVAVEVAVPIAIDAGAVARAGRHAGIRHRVAGESGERAEHAVVERRYRLTIGDEAPCADVEKANLLLQDPALGDEIALPGFGAGPQEIDARAHRRGARTAERRLLADDRRE